MRLFSLASMLPAVTMLILSGGIADQAHAYGWSECLGEKIKWDSNTKTLRASSESFPAGEWRNSLQSAIDRFNLNPSRFRYNLTTETGSVSRSNGQSEVWGSDDSDVLNGAPAIAYTRWTCYWLFGNHVELDSVDVIFDYGSPWIWSSSESKGNLLRYGGNGRSMRTTALHEIGHGLKLNHENDEYNVMGTDFEHIHVNGSSARAYLGEDSSDGAVFLYGTSSPAREDLGVVHWKYSGASGEYSDHAKTQLFSAANAILPSFNDGGETRYRVTRGQQVRAEFTYENNGANTQSNVPVGFYISTNSTISTADQRIGGISVNLSRGGVATLRTLLTIPSSLQANRAYWLGVIVDETGSLNETAAWNNATYLPIQTQ